MDDPETMKPLSHYLLKAGENYFCEDKDTSCHFCNKETLWEISSIKLLTAKVTYLYNNVKVCNLSSYAC